MKLILFDIDGTILFAHGVGRKSVEAAFHTVYGRPVTSENVRFSGKTDRQILNEIIVTEGLEALTTDDMRVRLAEEYTREMFVRMADHHVDVLPGVRPLLEALHARSDVHLALLTGNLEPLAYLKLQAVGLADYFRFGAFGSDSVRRDDLPAIALRRAEDILGHTFSGKDVVIVGDTEHDVTCGKSLGVTAIAVTTGNYSREDLYPHEPDHCLDDLTDTRGFVQLLGLTP